MSQFERNRVLDRVSEPIILRGNVEKLLTDFWMLRARRLIPKPRRFLPILFSSRGAHKSAR